MIDGLMDRWMMDRCLNRMDGLIKGWMDDGWVDGRKNGWIDG